LVYQRDKGVCSLCRMHTDRVLREIRVAVRLWPSSVPPYFTYVRIGSLWDMDHITPVVEGGGECGLDNLRTLCVWCHKRETAALARRRASARRPVQPVRPTVSQIELFEAVS
jgi:5-methylcytosine-specific restriction protein A